MARTRDGWTLGDAPSLHGKVAIVTGATGGIGYETALGLARRGATTILASRNPSKGAEAVARVRRSLPDADARFEMIDLNSLASVTRFADTILAAHPAVDILVNNAGVMGFPQRLLTEDGFERQIGVNYLSHFALTGRLLHALEKAEGGGRVVSVASLAHRRATLDLGDLQSERGHGTDRDDQHILVGGLAQHVDAVRGSPSGLVLVADRALRKANDGWGVLDHDALAQLLTQP